MLVLLSHALTFAVLSAASISDLKTSEVADEVSIVGVLGGLGLHFAASLNAGIDFSTLSNLGLIFNDFSLWLSALGEPLLWSLGVGAAFSLYGWGLYYLGMWGGADAFAMSVLGFGSPYAVAGASLLYPTNLFVNILIVGFVYTIVYSVYKTWDRKEVWQETRRKIVENESRIALEIVASALFSLLASRGGISAFAYFGAFLVLIFLYRFLDSVQEELMHFKVPVSELKGGEVLAPDQGFGREIKGITKEEIETIEEEEVEVREGVRFIPVFPIALFLTDFFGLGITLITFFVN